MKNILKLKNKFIPVNRPKIFPEDIKNVSRSLKEKWISVIKRYWNKVSDTVYLTSIAYLQEQISWMRANHL